MEADLLARAAELGPEEPIQIAERIWWVGHYLEGDPFQCHVYLIENGDNSVLIDPGSKLTFDTTLRKIEQIVPFESIRYFVLQHQDPDITGVMPVIDSMVTRDDAVILSHWRAIVLLKHYGLELPFQCVEKLGWSLDLGGRTLEFVFTPYLHFPGAFTTFDRSTGVLFSSDIFGGFTEGFTLVAQDEGYFEAMRPFHEHYMPSREVLFDGLAKIEALPLQMICPQHGSIIPRHLIDPIIKELKNIDCGIYTLVQTSSEIQRLSELNRMLHAFVQTLILRRDFATIAADLIEQLGKVLPIAGLCFHARDANGRTLLFEPETHYRGVETEMPKVLDDALGITREAWTKRFGRPFTRMELQCARLRHKAAEPPFILPLFSSEEEVVHGFAVLTFPGGTEVDAEAANTLVQMSIPLSVAVEREVIFQSLDRERQKFYERSIRDPLTGLYTRLYMQETVQRFLDIHDRDAAAGVSVVVLDLDNFKGINDTFGHHVGDEVLRIFADVIRRGIRHGDVPVRLGGEEFAVFVVGSSAPKAPDLAERIRAELADTDLGTLLDGRKLTVSAGVAFRAQREPLDAAVERADIALYQAKHQGKNRVVIDPLNTEPA